MKRLIAALAALFLALPAGAQEYPTRTISMIVVFAPGGATDVLAHIVAEHMMRTLGQRVVVENVNGAGGTIGGARGALAAPDGYMLTVGSLGVTERPNGSFEHPGGVNVDVHQVPAPSVTYLMDSPSKPSVRRLRPAMRA